MIHLGCELATSETYEVLELTAAQIAELELEVIYMRNRIACWLLLFFFLLLLVGGRVTR
jgi:hypothetical protein